MTSPRRFLPPWTAEVTPNCFIVRDANGQALSYAYYEMSPVAARRPSCSAKTRPAGSRRISRSCQSCCGGAADTRATFWRGQRGEFRARSACRISPNRKVFSQGCGGWVRVWTAAIPLALSLLMSENENAPPVEARRFVMWSGGRMVMQRF